jgi:hypothetical protein
VLAAGRTAGASGWGWAAPVASSGCGGARQCDARGQGKGYTARTGVGQGTTLVAECGGSSTKGSRLDGLARGAATEWHRAGHSPGMGKGQAATTIQMMKTNTREERLLTRDEWFVGEEGLAGVMEQHNRTATEARWWRWSQGHA